MSAFAIPVPEVIANLASISPFVALLGWLFWQERGDRKCKEKLLEDQHEKLLEVFQANIKTNTELKNAVDNNTRSTDNLSQTVYHALGGNGRRGDK
jgi:hypothetical protein